MDPVIIELFVWGVPLAILAITALVKTISAIIHPKKPKTGLSLWYPTTGVEAFDKKP